MSEDATLKSVRCLDDQRPAALVGRGDEKFMALEEFATRATSMQ